MTANKHNIVLEPGRMVVLTKQELSDFEQLPIDCHRVNYCHAEFLSQKKSCDSLKVLKRISL